VFSVPVVLALSAALPIATLWLAVVFPDKATYPRAILLPPVVFASNA